MITSVHHLSRDALAQAWVDFSKRGRRRWHYHLVLTYNGKQRLCDLTQKQVGKFVRLLSRVARVSVLCHAFSELHYQSGGLHWHLLLHSRACSHDWIPSHEVLSKLWLHVCRLNAGGSCGGYVWINGTGVVAAYASKDAAKGGQLFAYHAGTPRPGRDRFLDGSRVVASRAGR